MTQKTKEYAAGPLKFVAILLLLAGILNIVDGAAAIGGDTRFNEDRLLFESLTGWGIAYIIIGLLQIYAAAMVRARQTQGLLLAIGFSCLSGIAHFISIGAYPIWSITVMILNFAVLFILLTNDDEF